MKPTVLIGLGGVGSRAVDKIYGMMSEAEKKNTATAVLDTDVGDLQKLKNVEVKIQTSPDVKVGNYVHRHREVMEWFPYEYDKINNLMLSDGAGQVRALSRLAFYSALERGAVAELDRAVEKLSMLNDSGYTSDVNIVVLGTISGGTCSGSFIQMGLYMRHYFAEKNPNASVFIQGVFLLPDTLTTTGTLVHTEWDNVRFNAYAALKELNALLSPTVVKNTNIELEYRPGVDKRITSENKAYDNILFFDYENTKNQHLQSFSDYTALLSETVYYAYISPMAADYQSRFVNQIRTFIMNNQESFYSASSVNRLIYPYADIIKYLSLEWIIEEIGSEWLEFDKQYQEEMRQYRKDSDMGIRRPKPVLEDLYIDGLDMMEKKEDRKRFYTAILNQTRIKDDEQKIVGRRDAAFVQEIDAHIAKILEQDKEFSKQKQRCEIQHMMLEDIDNAQGHIAELENNLKKFYNGIDETVYRHQSMLLKDILTNHCGETQTSSESKYNINYWMISEKQHMHPVAIRYFLYRTRKSLNKKLLETEEEAKKSKSFIDSYYKKYDIPTSRDTADETYYETAEEVMALISGQTAIDKLKHFVTNNKTLQFKPFIELFNEHYTKQVRHIGKFTELKLKQNVIEKLLAKLEVLIQGWEGLFDMLSKDLMDDIVSQRNAYISLHESGDKDIFIFGPKEHKKKLWEKEVRIGLSDNVDNATLNNAIAKTQYELFCKKISPENYFEADGTYFREVYGELLVDAYQNALTKLKDKELKVGILDAITMESRVMRDDKITFKNYIERLEHKNLPWMNTSSDKLALTKFWGIADKSLLDKRYMEEGTPTIEGNTVIDSGFSAQEIVYLVMYHNLSVTDFAKFAVKDTFSGAKIEGVYFRAYRDLMDNIAKDPARYVTPHIDKRWNSPTYLPDLNDSVAEQTSEEVAQAFVLGLSMDVLTQAQQDGKNYFYENHNNRTNKIMGQSGPIDADKWLNLYDALKSNPVIRGNVLTRYNEIKEEAFKVSGWEVKDDAYLKKVATAKALKVLVAMQVEEVRSEEDAEIVNTLIENYGKEITSYIAECYGELKHNTAAKESNAFKEKMLKKAISAKVDSGIKQAIESTFLG